MTALGRQIAKAIQNAKPGHITRDYTPVDQAYDKCARIAKNYQPNEAIPDLQEIVDAEWVLEVLAKNGEYGPEKVAGAVNALIATFRAPDVSVWLTDEMVERAAEAMYYEPFIEGDDSAIEYNWEEIHYMHADAFRRKARAALEAGYAGG